MTTKVIDIRTQHIKDELDTIYQDLKSGVRKNAIIISEIKESQDEIEGALDVIYINVVPSRLTLGMLMQTQTLTIDECYQ